MTFEDDFAQRLTDLAKETPHSPPVHSVIAAAKRHRARRGAGVVAATVTAVVALSATSIAVAARQSDSAVNAAPGAGGFGAASSSAAASESAKGTAAPSDPPGDGLATECATPPVDLVSGTAQKSTAVSAASYALTLKPADFGVGWHEATAAPIVTTARGELLDRAYGQPFTANRMPSGVIGGAHAAAERPWDAGAGTRFTVLSGAFSTVPGHARSVAEQLLLIAVCQIPGPDPVLVEPAVMTNRSDSSSGAFIVRIEDTILHNARYSAVRWQGNLLVSIDLEGSAGDLLAWQAGNCPHGAAEACATKQPDTTVLPGIADWLSSASQAALDKALGKTPGPIPTLG